MFKTHKKTWLLPGAALLAAALTVAGYIIIFGGNNDSRSTNIQANASNDSAQQLPEEKLDTRIPSPLSGELVEPESTKRTVTAVVIENSPDARPQSGLSQAGVVFEAIAEGGITRFVALFQENRPDPVGPIRSLRPYFIDWSLMYNAPIAHVGGSEQAKIEAQTTKIRDLDEFANQNYFYRSRDRFAPHNMYSNFDLLDKLNKQKGFESSEFLSLARKDDSPATLPTATNIGLDISSPLYRVDYTYNASTNSYDRNLGNVAHTDKSSAKQLSPKVVVVLKTNHQVIEGGLSQYRLTGSGQTVIFQDGEAIEATWSRSSRSDQFVFKDSTGQTIEFNRGQTWITAIDVGRRVTY